MYPSADAVEDSAIINGIVMSKSETNSAVAVKVTAADPSVTESDEKANVTTEGSLISTIVAVIAELSLNVPLDTSPGVTIIVSSASSSVSRAPVKVIVPVTCPAGTLISGVN